MITTSRRGGRWLTAALLPASVVIGTLGLSGPASAADTYSTWQMAGTAGDHVTGGSSYSFSAPSSTFSVSGAPTYFTAGVNQASPSHWFYGLVALPEGDTEPGLHADAQRTGGSASGGFEIFGDGRGCNQSIGTYRIHEITVDPDSSEVTSVAMSWEVHCELGTASNQGFFAVNATGTAPSETTTTLTAPSSRPTGTDLALSGTVSDGSAGVAGGDVEIRRTDADGITNRGVVQTDASGAFTFHETTGATSAFYTAVYLGDDAHRVSSATKKVTVGKLSSTLTTTAPAKAKRGATVTAHGTLRDSDGPLAGATVTVTRKDLGGTHVSSVRTGTDGTWSTRAVLRIGGPNTWTASFAGDTFHKAASAKASTAVARTATRITIALNDQHVGYGASVKATIHLGATYNSRVVTVMQDKAGDGAPAKKIATRKVNSKGVVTIKVTVSRNTKLTARFLGDYRKAPASSSAKVTVAGRVALILAGYDTRRSDGYYVFRGDPVAKAHVLPTRAGGCAHAYVQTYLGGAWRTTATLSCLTLDSLSNGYLSYQNSIRPPGVHFRMRVSVSKSSVSDASSSPWRYFTYR